MSLQFERMFTKNDTNPYAGINFVERNVVIGNGSRIIFEQNNVVFPDFWSKTAVDITTSKYFYGTLGTEDREFELVHLINRVVEWTTNEGIRQNYFDKENSIIFQDELKYMLIHQMVSFNSPVWFNIGNPYSEPQISACFIVSALDNMESILDNVKTEGMLFKYGSGAGSNRSRLRSSKENLSGGGKASGPNSFMKIYDTVAQTIKSGGKCYRRGTLVQTPYEFIPVEELKIGDTINTHLGHKKILDFMENGKKEYYTVSTKEGYTVDITKGHQFAYWNNEKMNFDVKPIEHFQNGDQLYLLLSESNGNDTPLYPYEALSNSHATTTQEITSPQYLQAELSYIIGLMYGDGCANEQDEIRIPFAQDRTGLLSMQNTIEFSQKLFDYSPSVMQGNGKLSMLQFSQVNIARFLGQNGFLKGKADNLIFPEKFLSANKSDRYAFIAGLIDSDGSFEKRGGFSLRMIDKKFLEKTQLLLLSLGIPSKLRLSKEANDKKNWQSIWQLSVVNQIFVEKLYNGIKEYSAKAKLLYKPNKVAKSWGFKDLNFESFFKTTVRGMQTELDRKFGRNNSTIPYSAIKFYNDEYPESQIGKVCKNLSQVVPITFVDLTLSGIDDTYDIEVEDAHLLSANGIYASNTRRAAKMEILDIDHGDIVEFINQKGEEEKKAKHLISGGWNSFFDDPNGAYASVFFQNSNQSVSISDAFMQAVEKNEDWALLERNPDVSKDKLIDWNTPKITNQGVFVNEFAKLGAYLEDNGKYFKVIEWIPARKLMRLIAQKAWESGDPGVQFNDTMNKWHTCPASDKIRGTNPCSEYVFIDDTSCNLASFNLLKFYNKKSFEIEQFQHSIRLMTTAMDIFIDAAHYPTEKIAEETRKYRTLGLGYANLGALLIAKGYAYDSEEGRNYAAAITALLTGSAYFQSQQLALALGSFKEFEKNKESIHKIISQHDRAIKLPATGDDTDVAKIWRAAKGQLSFQRQSALPFAIRNAQVTVLAPTGTISFMMDCDTTGVEPMLGLVQYKSLAGGGVIKIIPKIVANALEDLGYPNVQAIKDGIALVQDIRQLVQSKDLPVFATSLDKNNMISYEGHIKMMAAIQPFLSGAISKTVNMPNSATVEDIEKVYIDSWKLGLKAVAIYRNGCKMSQPVSITDKEKTETYPTDNVETKKLSNGRPKPIRKKLPDTRNSVTHKFNIAGHTGYLTVGKYENDQPGEIFCNVSKEGSTLRGIMDSWAMLFSMLLQYGAPVEDIADKLKNVKFEPAGITQNKDIRFATSIVDYIGKWLEAQFVKSNSKTNEEKEDETLNLTVEKIDYSGPPCQLCGSMTVKSGSCHVCPNCGETTGCS